MDLWFSEFHTKNVKLSIKVTKQVCSVLSDYQKIDVFESDEFGRFLTLDGYMMLTERDEFIYHEMIVHTPMAVHPDCKRVLVIGAGDGGVIRELVKYKNVEQIDVCEIDKKVVDVCKEFMPKTACAFEDNRVYMYYQDGLKFVRKCENLYDLIIVDSTDPGGPGEPLFGIEFYKNMRRALKDGGVIGSQSESPFLLPDVVKSLQNISRECFEYSAYGMFYVPTYPTGNIGICVGGVGVDPRMPRREAPENLRYYNSEIHKSAFVLPQFVQDLLK